MNTRTMLAAVAGALAATAAAGGVAWAAIGDGGVIQGCYDKFGNLKVVSALPCPKGYTALTWNQQGAKGDTGDVGPTGLQGPQGPAGEDGAPGAGAGETKALNLQPGAAVTLFDRAEIGTITASCVDVFDPGSEVDLQWTYTNTSGQPQLVLVSGHNSLGIVGAVIQDGDSRSGLKNTLDDHIVITPPFSSSMPWADVTITGTQPNFNDPSCVLLAHASTGD